MRVLITAGTVYGPLDANKLVGNRVRGLWAAQFAEYLLQKGHEVTLLIPDTMPKEVLYKHVLIRGSLHVMEHKGFWDYEKACVALAREHDAAVMAAAVVNWIPAEPFEGKMPTKGYKEGDILQVPFILAPHVIDKMKVANPKLTLIGCKMLVNATEGDLIEAAYGVLLKAKCNAVVANDMGRGLKRKLVVHQDRTVLEYNDDFEGFYANLLGHIEDIHYSTQQEEWSPLCEGDIRPRFDAVVTKYRGRFIRRAGDSDRVFGAVFVPSQFFAKGLVSPREKGALFTSSDAVLLETVINRVCYVLGTNKATLNAPLLHRVSVAYPKAAAILHLHEQLSGVVTVPYAPPGTARDNEREIPGPVFNIEGHGFIACLDNNLDIWGMTP